MANTFVHLHVHTKYSVGQSTLYINANKKKDPNRQTILKLCNAFHMNAVAVTDTNLMSGTAELSDVAPGAGICPIVGVELTLNEHDGADPRGLRTESLSHIVLLAQNHDGYLNLVALNSFEYMRGENTHLGPYVTMDELAAHADGVICLSGGHRGPIGRALLEGQTNLADSLATRFRDIYGDRFYMELQRHGLDAEVKTEPEFLRIAMTQNIPIVATNDVCFAAPENYEATDALACIMQQTKIIDPDRARNNSEQYFKSADEMCELFADLPEACENTTRIAERCAFLVNTHSAPLLPRFGDNFDDECKMLRNNARTGLAQRMATEKIPDTEQKKYYDQLEYELDVIIKMGFPGYFLIVADYINWCRNNDVMVGPGRGSGAGSVVAWSLGITNVNPLKYGLLFERFLNPDRISMPDFDVDFEPAGLEKVTNYISHKYGAESFCRIITFGSLAARGALRDIGRVYGMPYSKTDRFAKLIPMDAKKIADAIEKSDEIQQVLDTDHDLKKVADVAMEIEGAFRNMGQHACGFVIGDRPTIEIAPVYRDPSNPMPSCQFDGHYLESVGLIKFDFLGLETLTILKYIIKMLRERGINIDLDAIPLDDAKTIELFRSGHTVGIFQFDAPFVQQTLKKMQPTSFANISALNALNRPGPIQYIPQYIARMHGEEPVAYPHPRAEEILRETYGIIVYQEQVMQLSRALAGFTRGESDTLRKAMGKKQLETMEKMHIKFLEGCAKEQTLNPTEAEALYQQFVKFAEYAFNKSHAVAYSVIAWQCAYLKAHFPTEFMAASMSSNLNDSDQLALFIDDARNNFGVEIVPPDINKSESLFSVMDGKIIFGLAAIKGVGQSATDQIVAERRSGGRFQNITDFAKRCAPFINKRVIESFARTGVFDSMIPNRAQIFMNADLIINFAANARASSNVLSLFEDTTQNDVASDRLRTNMLTTAPWDFSEKLNMEHSVLGYYISAHPIDQYKNLITKMGLTTSVDLPKRRDRSAVQMAVSIGGVSRRTTKTGNQMLNIIASDNYGNVDLVAFGDNVPTLAATLSTTPLCIISGRVSARDDRVSVFVDGARPLADWVAESARQLTLFANGADDLPKIKGVLDKMPAGKTKTFISMPNANGKRAIIALPYAVALSPQFADEFSAGGIRTSVE